MAPTDIANGTNTLPCDHLAPVLRAPLAPVLIKPDPSSLDAIESELLVIAVRGVDEEGAEFSLSDTIKAYDSASLDGVLQETIEETNFRGEAGKSSGIIRVVGAKSRRVALYGLGHHEEDLNLFIRKATAYAVEKGRGIKSCISIAVYIDIGAGAELNVANIAEAANMAKFVDERFKGAKKSSSKDDNDNAEKKSKKEFPSEVVLVGVSAIEPDDVEKGAAIARALMAAKELVMAPANSVTPERLADAAHIIAKEANLDIEVLGREECEKRGMGAYLSVTQGSLREPKFIHMKYVPENPTRRIALIGKAITHDTGGYNLKTSGGIASMKFDMAGSAAVIGAASIVGKLKPKGVEVHFVMPACENMVSEKAVHPGDIITASNGKTIEITNTDAEGRMCLADALVYAEKEVGEDIDAILCIATLTGSIGAALGNHLAGYYSSSQELADIIAKGPENTWRMPLVKEYSSKMKSKCADLQNSNLSSRAGGSIKAAMFLREFVKNKNWVHVDMANVATGEDGKPSGFGVKTLYHIVDSFAS